MDGAGDRVLVAAVGWPEITGGEILCASRRGHHHIQGRTVQPQLLWKALACAKEYRLMHIDKATKAPETTAMTQPAAYPRAVMQPRERRNQEAPRLPPGVRFSEVLIRPVFEEGSRLRCPLSRPCGCPLRARLYVRVLVCGGEGGTRTFPTVQARLSGWLDGISQG